MTTEKNIRCGFAGDTIGRNVKKLKTHLKEISAKKTENTAESLHQVRVCTRRTNAAMTVFKECFDPKDYKSLKKEFRNLRQVLGKVRDKDIQIGIIQNIEKQKNIAKSAKPGIKKVLGIFRNKRAKLENVIEEAISDFNGGDTVDRIKKAMKPFENNDKSKGVCLSMAIVEPVIMNRVGTVMDGLSKQTVKNNPDEIHKIRIMTKKIRYTMEFFPKDVLAKLEPYIEKVKKLQTILGNINDIDVFDRTLEKISLKQLKKIKDTNFLEEFNTGIDYLFNWLKKSRIKNIEELDKYYRTLLEDSFKVKLKNVLCSFTSNRTEEQKNAKTAENRSDKRHSRKSSGASGSS